MVIVLKADSEMQKQFFAKNLSDGHTLIIKGPGEPLAVSGADVYFDLSFNETHLEQNEFINDVPVFINAVSSTCFGINHKNYIRLNAWPGFFERSVAELACTDETYKQKASAIYDELGWKYIWVNDDHGLVSARVISMIINEAYFAYGEGVSTKQEIDTAMKLGTNYPFGPFEWAEQIGLQNVYSLLKKLTAANSRYQIAPALIKEVKQ